MAAAKGSGRMARLPWPHSPRLCTGGMLWEPPADLQLSLLSPGKVTSGNLGNSKAGEAGGESFLQYSRDHDRTFISTLMSGGISSPGGRARPTRLLTLFMRFLTFPAMKQQVCKLQLMARWGTGRTEQWKIHTCQHLRCAWTRKSGTRGCTTCSISHRPWLSFGLTYLPGCRGKSTAVMNTASARDSPWCGHKERASVLLCSRGERYEKRWNWRLWICCD